MNIRRVFRMGITLIVLCPAIGSSVLAQQRTIPIHPEVAPLLEQVASTVPPAWRPIGRIRPRAATEIGGSLLGIGGETLDRDFADFHAYQDYLAPLGAKRIRLQSGWAKTEQQPGRYDFAWLDEIVDGSLQCGVEPWLELSYGNPIYPGAGGTGLGQGLIQSKEGFAAWDRYVAATVRRYRDRAKIYEVWNEADLRANNARPEAYAELFVRTAEVIRREQPEAQILALALAGVSNMETVENFFGYLQAKGKTQLVDGITIHGYPKNPDDGFQHVARLRVYLDKIDPGIVIWQGESGAPSAEQPQFALSGIPWSELSQAKWNLRRALAHIGRGIPYSQFQISDMYYRQTELNTLNTKGLLQTGPDHHVVRPKAAYYAYQNLCAIIRDRLQPQGPAGPVSASMEKLSIFAFYDAVKGKQLFALWANGDRPGEGLDRTGVELELPQFRISEPVLVDLISGMVYAWPEEGIERRGAGARLKEVPIFDAPILIADRSLIPLLPSDSEGE